MFLLAISGVDPAQNLKIQKAVMRAYAINQ